MPANQLERCIASPILSKTRMRALVALVALTCLLASAMSAAGCRRKSAPPSAPAERPNVLLVTIDTLRADHLGCYGHQAAVTPTVDALARRGVRFETAVSH